MAGAGMIGEGPSHQQWPRRAKLGRAGDVGGKLRGSLRAHLENTSIAHIVG
jgi:hypothetical protein